MLYFFTFEQILSIKTERHKVKKNSLSNSYSNVLVHGYSKSHASQESSSGERPHTGSPSLQTPAFTCSQLADKILDTSGHSFPFFFFFFFFLSAKRKDESFFKGKPLEKYHTRAYNQPQPLSKCLERSRRQIRQTAAPI